jgi:16S rRNA (adenine1518-N6/adenine1519-N6)-dimethyltransferase
MNSISGNQIYMRQTGPKKKFGQNFLTSPGFAKKIADSIPAGHGETVLEIGAGRGALSIHLLERFHGLLHLVEMDRDMVPALNEKLGTGGWVLHQCDILDFEFKQFNEPVHVVGNLPYNIAALIIKKVLLCGDLIKSCTFMVQREVASRIVSGPHSKEAGFLSVFCQFFGKPEILFHVPPGAFFPKPKVDSSVFRIAKYPELSIKIPREQWKDFFLFVDRGFSQRRKMVVNSLAGTGVKTEISEGLIKAGIPVTARAEDIPMDKWIDFFSILRGGAV